MPSLSTPRPRPPPTQVYRPTGARLALMRAVASAMLLVAVAATIGSCYSLVNSLKTVEFFQ